MSLKMFLSKFQYLLIAVFSLAGVVVTYAVAAIPDSDGLIHACYKQNGGQLRVVESPTQCAEDEVSLDWNKQGLPGVSTGSGASAVFGHVSADGSLNQNRSQGIHNSSYSIQAEQEGVGSLYCLSVSALPNNVSVTLDAFNNGLSGSTAAASVMIKSNSSASIFDHLCDSADNVIVFTQQPAAFYVVVY